MLNSKNFYKLYNKCNDLEEKLSSLLEKYDNLKEQFNDYKQLSLMTSNQNFLVAEVKKYIKVNFKKFKKDKHEYPNGDINEKYFDENIEITRCDYTTNTFSDIGALFIGHCNTYPFHHTTYGATFKYINCENAREIYDYFIKLKEGKYES